MAAGEAGERGTVKASARRPDGPDEHRDEAGHRDEAEHRDEADRREQEAIRAQVVSAAEAEAKELRGEGPILGRPGPPVNRRSPFMIGLLGAAGVAVTYGAVHLLVVAGSILALIGLSLFLAIGLEPAVAWLMRRRLPRGVAVAIVAVAVVGMVVGFLVAAIPPLVGQVEAFVKAIPDYFAQMRDHSTTLGHLDARFHIHDRVTDLTRTSGPTLATGLLHVGQYVLSATVSTLTALVLTVYLLFDLPRIRRMIYRMVPASRRPRVIMIGDEVSAKVGGYVLGNLATSFIAGAGTLVWLLIFGVPYPFVLSIMVALLDLIPVIGSTVAGAIVSLVALTVSFPVALATLAFYIAYRLLEDYLIVPRIMGRAVRVPATVTIIAVLVGGAALGLLGALVAIPVAAAIDIILRETVYPRLDRA